MLITFFESVNLIFYIVNEDSFPAFAKVVGTMQNATAK